VAGCRPSRCDSRRWTWADRGNDVGRTSASDHPTHTRNLTTRPALFIQQLYNNNNNNYYYYYTVYRPFFKDNLGKPVPDK